MSARARNVENSWQDKQPFVRKVFFFFERGGGVFWRERKAQTNWIWSVWEPLLFEVKSVPRVSQRREEKKGEGWRGSAQKFRFFNSVSQNYPGLSFFFSCS